ncbi:hypothetical protein DFR29_102148 [Tahibacter aquaticus]|uniref:Uncharacterized protein n=1 Tax=Tahibacter aquaticus TaxID=520092 RepID=A0A4R6Z6T3_9GAMM|nr:hypothetical protein [Tahibacter aquaticus]TDR47488.1 hypothetical protein DFR29_102148 [Tahibacter aquaticus]
MDSRVRARAAAAADDPLLARRGEYEDRLGHYLSMHPRAMAVSRAMAAACGRYLREKSRRSGSAAAARRTQYAQLVKVMKPILLPFAGRLRNVGEWMRALDGEGNIREVLGTAWLFYRNVLAEDLVGPAALPDQALDIAAAAGFDVALLGQWTANAVAHAQAERGVSALPLLDSKMDLFRMPWHRANRLHQETCVIASWPPPTSRFWSQQTRAEFVRHGGVFSEPEKTYSSPAGKDKVPWLDARRYCGPDASHALVTDAARRRIPMRTGVSRASMQLMYCGRLANIGDEVSLRLAVMGYLLPVRAHSLYEIAIGSSAESVALEDIRYDAALLDGVDLGSVAAHCGDFPAQGETG